MDEELDLDEMDGMEGEALESFAAIIQHRHKLSGRGKGRGRPKGGGKGGGKGSFGKGPPPPPAGMGGEHDRATADRRAKIDELKKTTRCA
eukprot:7508796-Alexandrium_andersonii.AAC.1